MDIRPVFRSWANACACLCASSYSGGRQVAGLIFLSFRDAHAAKFNYDLRAIYADLKKSEAEHIAAGHPFIPPPSAPPVPDSALQRTRFARR